MNCLLLLLLLQVKQSEEKRISGNAGTHYGSLTARVFLCGFSLSPFFPFSSLAVDRYSSSNEITILLHPSPPLLDVVLLYSIFR